MGDEVEFLPAGKHERFLQDGSINLGVNSQTGPKYQKQSVYNIFAISIPKKVRDEVDFFDTGKHQSFLTVDFNTLGIKFFYNVTGMIMKT